MKIAKAGLSTYLFPVGLLMALILAFMSNGYVLMLMGIIGLVVGFMNYQKSETQKGLLFIIAMFTAGIGTGVLSGTGMVGDFLEPILLNIASFFSFAATAMLVTAGFRILKK